MIDQTDVTFLALVIFIALIFELSNGFNDAANAIATVVSTRVMSPFTAVVMAAVMNFLGAISGTAVAKTVGKGVVDPAILTGGDGLVAVGGGVTAAACWVFAASRLGMPVSGSHSLIAGVAGAGIAHAGWGVLVAEGMVKIGRGLVFSPQELYRRFPKLPENDVTREMARLLSSRGHELEINGARRQQGLIEMYRTMTSGRGA